ncbi:OmpA family protein [Vibrio agarivorans]|uniref:OmpA family protein n=1 Tax=Vibrio agarivorans TaxID=153622 RepID=A0ABT7Y7I0_9VIBR|nr:OmpA family protein [Vibrio agarivorans]MDN2483946.1 OmpA family protein [Vibrio agarivorans]
MSWKSYIKTIGLVATVVGVVGCAQPKEDEVIYSNVIYSPDTRIDGYFDDQYTIFKSIYSDFIVERVSDREIKIVIPSQYGYAVDKSTLNRNMRNHLAAMSKTLRDYRDTAIVIHGHTDHDGNMRHNLKLAQARADSVKVELLKNHIDSNRIKTVAESFEMPRCPNTTAVGKECNRRVEIIVKAQPFNMRNM